MKGSIYKLSSDSEGCVKVNTNWMQWFGNLINHHKEKKTSNVWIDIARYSKIKLRQGDFYHCVASSLVLTTVSKRLRTVATSCWTFGRGMLSRSCLIQNSTSSTVWGFLYSIVNKIWENMRFPSHCILFYSDFTKHPNFFTVGFVF